MIDYIKSKNIKTDINELYNNSLLEFESKVNEKTGEVKENYKIAKYKDITFEIVGNKYINLKGSLHKYSNNGNHNYNDFTFDKLIDVIIDLHQNFNINPYNAPINNIEFAVNINTSFKPKDFIKNNIINHKGNQPSIKTFKGLGYLKEFEQTQYYLKIYDKGLHYKQPKNIFRFEVKVMKMQYLKKIGINNLSDLLNKDKLKSLGMLLVETFNNLLIIDNTININTLNAKEKILYQNGINPMFWTNLKPDTSNYKNDLQYNRDRKKYYRTLKQFNNLLETKKQNNLKKEVSKIIYNKWNELLNIDDKKRDKFTDFRNIKKGTNLPTLKNDKKGQIYTSNIELICTQKEKKCLVTFLDISMQKETSKFLSISGIKFYQNNNSKIYKELKKRLSYKWNNANIEIQINEIAHSIRNEYFNKLNNNRNNTKRRINKILSIPSLFDNMQLISKEKLQIAEMH